MKVSTLIRPLTAMRQISGAPSWQQTMLRVKDPSVTIPELTGKYGMTLLDRYDFDSFSLYFLASIRESERYTLTPGSNEAHRYLWTTSGVTLELTHNHGTENDSSYQVHPGNEDGDGFGHIAFNTDDVYKSSAKLLDAGIDFKKKPDEGRMKGLAFAYSHTDKYWIELVKRGENSGIKEEFNLSQTMLRVKDPVQSIAFYESLGMTKVYEHKFDSFALYFLASLPEGVVAPPADSGDEARTFIKNMHSPLLELTHNFGTEENADFTHFNGNEEGRQGFGHLGFLVDDVELACADLVHNGCVFKKEPNAGTMKGLAFVLDPDGYSVEIIKRGGYDDDNAQPFYY